MWKGCGEKKFRFIFGTNNFFSWFMRIFFNKILRFFFFCKSLKSFSELPTPFNWNQTAKHNRNGNVLKNNFLLPISFFFFFFLWLSCWLINMSSNPIHWCFVTFYLTMCLFMGDNRKKMPSVSLERGRKPAQISSNEKDPKIFIRHFSQWFVRAYEKYHWKIRKGNWTFFFLPLMSHKMLQLFDDTTITF